MDIMSKLNSFHRRRTIFLKGRHIGCIDEEWLYPDTKTTMEQADLLTMEQYMDKQRETVNVYVEPTEAYRKCKLSQSSTRDNNRLVWRKTQVKKNEEEVT